MPRIMLVALALLFLSSPVVPAQTSPPQSAAGGVSGEETHFQLIRSVSGSKGEPDGAQFVVQDPRTVFYVPQDRQVIVYMEWDGPLGQHDFEGSWRSPDGKVVAASNFSYEAKQKRFSGYWTLALADRVQTGNWTLEAHVDGEAAGVHSFQILLSAPPADVSSPRKPLTSPELYSRATNSMVSIERLDAQGNQSGQGSGFLLSPGLVVTAFDVIDGAAKARITFPDGRKIESDHVIAWDRRKNWAVLQADTGKLVGLERAATGSWNVGDVASFLDASPGGNRVITNVRIEGKSDYAIAGPRLNISFMPPGEAIGSALLDQYGDAIGITMGGLIRGANALAYPSFGGDRISVPRAASVVRGGIALPISELPVSVDSGKSVSFADMVTNGQFIVPVSANRNVVYGQLARSVNKPGGVNAPMEGGDTYSRRDGKMYVYVMWEGHEKAKGLLTMRIYDLDNRLLNQADVAKPGKLSLDKGERSTSTWEFSVGALPLGFYRVDVCLDSEPAWRAFFQVTE